MFDVLLFEYINEHTISSEDPHDQFTLGWNDSIIEMGKDIMVNAGFSEWLKDRFADEETGEAFLHSFSDFLLKD